MLIFVAGHPPIYGRQILYFLDPVFSERVKVEAGNTDVLRDHVEIDTEVVNVDLADTEISAPDPQKDSDDAMATKKKMRR